MMTKYLKTETRFFNYFYIYTFTFRDLSESIPIQLKALCEERVNVTLDSKKSSFKCDLNPKPSGLKAHRDWAPLDFILDYN